MRISDWSSDVCSSDLDIAQVLLGGACASLRQATIGSLIVQPRGLDLVDRNAGAGGIHPAKRDLGLGIAGLRRLCVPCRSCRGVDIQSVRAIAEGMAQRSEEHTSELQSLMRISYAV